MDCITIKRFNFFKEKNIINEQNFDTIMVNFDIMKHLNISHPQFKVDVGRRILNYNAIANILMINFDITLTNSYLL